MFQPLSLFIGLRYVRARQHKFFVSFITWVSLAGVALGVAALIVVLSVMNGLEGEVRTRLLSLSAHARVVSGLSAATAADSALESRLRALPGVVGVAPYTDLQALAMHQPEMLPLTLRGIDPAAESQVTDLKPLLLQGKLEDLRSGSNALILGRSLAEQLGVVARPNGAYPGPPGGPPGGGGGGGPDYDPGAGRHARGGAGGERAAVHRQWHFRSRLRGSGWRAGPGRPG
jgi:lipoprotein-releasing system permease protein